MLYYFVIYMKDKEWRRTQNMEELIVSDMQLTD